MGDDLLTSLKGTIERWIYFTTQTLFKVKGMGYGMDGATITSWTYELIPSH